MKNILMCVLAVSIFTLIALCLLIVRYKNIKIRIFERRVKNIINAISFISTAFAIITLVISILGMIMQIKSPELQIGIYTMHEVPWEEENGNQNLCLSYDDNGHACFEMSAPRIWHLHIKNEGNQYAENVKIKIQFEDFVFISEPDSFTLSDHLYAMPFFRAIERTFDQIIQPGETVEVPYFPLEYTELFESYNSDYTYMNIEVYENSSLVLKRKIYIEIVDNSMIEDRYVSNEDKMIREFNEFYFDHADYRFECELNLDLAEIYPRESAFTLEDHEKVYKHYLNLINTYNPSTASVYSKLAVFYGRLYYRTLSKEISGIDVEQAVKNDMEIRWKYGEK